MIQVQHWVYLSVLLVTLRSSPRRCPYCPGYPYAVKMSKTLSAPLLGVPASPKLWARADLPACNHSHPFQKLDAEHKQSCMVLPHLLPRASAEPRSAQRRSVPEQKRLESVILLEENGLPEHMGLNCRETEP